MTSEVKSLQVQKQVEELKRKLRDANHEKIQALTRCNEDWETKLSSQTSLSLRRQEVEHQKEIETLRTELQVQAGRSVAEVAGEKEAELKKLKDTLGLSKESAVKQAIFLSEEKHNEMLKMKEDEWRTKERSLTREIFHLSDERQQTNNQLAVLRESDTEKAVVIRRLNFDHGQAVKEMIDVSKQDQSKEYSRYKAVERCAQEREFEVRRLEGKVDVLRVDKELLEKQLLTLKKYYSPDTSPTVARVMRFTDREREQSKKIRDLEDRLRNLQRERGSVTPSGGLSPSETHSPDSEEKLASIKKQRKELREKVRKLEEKCSSLEQRNSSLESDSRLEEEYIQREIMLKQKYSVEIEQLENEAHSLRENIHNLSVTDNTNQELDEMALIVERCENRYKQLYFEHLMSQQMTLLWSEDKPSQNEAIVSLEMELEEKVKELGELSELNDSYKIRIETLRNEYVSVQGQNEKLIEERDQSESARKWVDEELGEIRETANEYTHRISEKDLEIGELFQANERLKSQQEGFSLLMDKQIQEIEMLKGSETENNSQKQQFESLKGKLLLSEGKERELMAIIQTLEDRNSELQNELQLKEDELASKPKRKPREDKNYGRSEVLFYPQPLEFNNNNHNNNGSSDDESEDYVGGKHEILLSASEEERVVYSSESNTEIENVVPGLELAPLSVDQLSDSSSSPRSVELSPIHVLSDSPKTPPRLRDVSDSEDDGGNSIGEWSHTSDENLGATPSSPNLSPIPTPKKPPMKESPDVYLVRYNYNPLLSSPNPNPEQELSLVAGGYVYIYGIKDEDGFYLGELPGGKHGLVPSNFVEKVKVKPFPYENSPDGDKPISTVEQLDSAKGPLELYLKAQSGADSSNPYNYNSNLSNIIEEDESVLDESYLTKISGNISSTESIKIQTSNESLDKISELQSTPPSPGHIPPPSDIKVNHKADDIEIHWTEPFIHEITGYNITVGDGAVHSIDGNRSSVMLSDLDSKLNPDINTLTLSTVTPLGTSEGVGFIVDNTDVPAPYGLYFNEEENDMKVSWQTPDTKSLSSPLISFQVHLNGELVRTLDYSEFLIDKGVTINEADLLKSDTRMVICVSSMLSDGRQSQLSDALELPSRFSTSSDVTPIRMISMESDSTEEGSRRSSSSESEVLEVFRKSSLESDQLLKKIHATSLQENTEVVSKPPIDPRTVPLVAGQRQSFTPNEDDLFTELEAQGAYNVTPSPIFSLEDTHSQSDSEDELDSPPQYTDIPTLDVTVTYYVALYDYHPKDQPTEPDLQPELTLQKGDVVAIYGEKDPDGFLQAHIDDNVGLVPYNLVEEIDLSDISGETNSALLFQATKQAFPAKKFTALYPYNPRVDSPNSEDMDDELSFESGASISIYGNVQEDGFYIGEQDGEMGFVPSNFVESNDHIKPPQSHQPFDTSTNGSKGASSLEPHKTNKTILAKTKGIFKSLSKKS